jgi:hypothetical protein
MPKADVFPETFRTLRDILEKHRGKMIVTADTPTDYSLASGTMTDRSGRPLFAAAVQIKKSYVSFHFMPIYADPGLRDSLSPALRKRMQGKGCFNFTTVEPAQARELSAVIKKGIAGFKNLQLPWVRPR